MNTSRDNSGQCLPLVADKHEVKHLQLSLKCSTLKVIAAHCGCDWPFLTQSQRRVRGGWFPLSQVVCVSLRVSLNPEQHCCCSAGRRVHCLFGARSNGRCRHSMSESRDLPAFDSDTRHRTNRRHSGCDWLRSPTGQHFSIRASVKKNL